MTGDTPEPGHGFRRDLKQIKDLYCPDCHTNNVAAWMFRGDENDLHQVIKCFECESEFHIDDLSGGYP